MNSRSAKFAILTHFERGPELWFLWIFAFSEGWNLPNYSFSEQFELLKLLESAKLISLKIWKSEWQKTHDIFTLCPLTLNEQEKRLEVKHCKVSKSATALFTLCWTYSNCVNQILFCLDLYFKYFLEKLKVFTYILNYFISGL